MCTLTYLAIGALVFWYIVWWLSNYRNVPGS